MYFHRLTTLMFLIVLLGGTGEVWSEPVATKEAKSLGQSPKSADTSMIKHLNLNGYWNLTKLQVAGAFSGGDEERANQIIGKKIFIHELEINLPDDNKCRILSSSQIVLKDERHSGSAETHWKGFGSAGGSWKELGLSETSKGNYKVISIRFAEGGDYCWGLTIQEDQHIYLFEVGGVYVEMKKLP